MMISDTSSSSSLLSVRDVWVTGLMLGTLFSEELLLRLFCDDDDCDCDSDEDEDEDADTIGVKLTLTAVSGSIPTTTTWSTIRGSFLLRNCLHSTAKSL